MSREDYVARHKLLGLCRACPKPLVEGSTIYCLYHRDKDRLHGRIRDKRLAKKLKEECFKHYGKVCSCCNESILEFLTLDHIDGNGNIHRKMLFKHNVGGVHMYRWLKKHDYPNGYKILCMNCNWAKRYSKICPHEIRRDG